MELNTIKDAFDRVAKKQKTSSSRIKELVDQVGGEIDQAVAKVQAANDLSFPVLDILKELNNKLNEIGVLNQFEGSLKELNVGLNKYVKLLEKSFNTDISKAYRNVDFDVHTVNQIIACHFYRHGMFDIGDCFIHEAQEEVTATLRSSYWNMYQILEALKAKNLEPALGWASAQHDHLAQNGSILELKLHRLQFLEILQKKGKGDALKYARSCFAPFAGPHMGEIQKLMACLLWADRLESSPYAEFLSPTQWEKLAEELTQQFCHILGQSYVSPLNVVIEAGLQGLPTLLKLANVMSAKKHEWQAMKQLPVPVDLDREFQFHSIFVCPVSRDQGSLENPPLLMSCGHVLCKQSIMKLSKNSTRSFKCPYCPHESTVVQCRQLHF